MKNNLLPKHLLIRFYLYKYCLYAFIFIMIFAFAFLLHKHIEAFFILLSYALLRYRFPKTFHHPNTYWCVFWSIFAFWLCIVAVLPLRYSILSCVVVALLLCYILFKIQDYVDAKKELEEIDHKPFDLKTCTKEELIQRCKELNISSQSTQIAVAYFIDKNKSIYDIARENCIEYESARKRIQRIKRKLTE